MNYSKFTWCSPLVICYRLRTSFVCNPRLKFRHFSAYRMALSDVDHLDIFDPSIHHPSRVHGHILRRLCNKTHETSGQNVHSIQGIW